MFFPGEKLKARTPYLLKMNNISDIPLGSNGEYGALKADAKGFKIEIGPDGIVPYGASMYEYQARLNASIYNFLQQCKAVRNEKGLTWLISSAKLAAQLGAGKTCIFLAMITEMLNSPVSNEVLPIIHYAPTGTELDQNNAPGYHIIEKRYSSSNVLNIAFIFSTPATFHQMMDENAKRKINLRVFPVENVHGFRAMLSLIDKGLLASNYDAVLFIVATSAAFGQTTRLGCEHSLSALVTSFAERRLAIKFAIYDDYDTGLMGHDSPLVPSLMSLYVSATSRDGAEKEKKVQTVLNYNYTDLITPLLIFTGSISSVVINNANLPVGTVSDEIVRTETKIPALRYIEYVFKKSIDQLMTLARMIANDEYLKYLELVNNNSYEEAAKVINSGSTSPEDVLMNLFRSHVEGYNSGSRGMKLIKQITEGVETQKRWEANTRENKHGSFDEVKAIIKQYANTGNARVVRVGIDTIRELSTESAKGLGTLLAEYKATFQKHSQAVSTMMANFENAASMPCPCCADPNKKPTTLITCCLKLVCERCLVGGKDDGDGKVASVFQFRKSNAGGVVRNCGLCQTTETIARPIHSAKIVNEVGGKIQIDLNAWFAQTDAQKNVPPPEKKFKTKGGPKNTALVKLCKGIALVAGENKLLKMIERPAGFANQQSAIISGSGYVEAPADEKQMLVVGESSEALKKTMSVLEDNGITCQILGGAPKDIADTVKAHEERKFQVLLMSRQVTCQGLNLQHCSSIVFMHRLIDKTAEAQFIGRIQRSGRKFTGTVYSLLYQNEA
jgi:hypothetical protein